MTPACWLRVESLARPCSSCTGKSGVICWANCASVLSSALHTPPIPHFLPTHPQARPDSICWDNRKEEGGEALLSARGQTCDYSSVLVPERATQGTFLLSHHIVDLGDMKMGCMCVCVVQACMHTLTYTCCQRQCVRINM